MGEQDQAFTHHKPCFLFLFKKNSMASNIIQKIEKD